MGNPLETVAIWAFGVVCGVVVAGLMYLVAWLIWPLEWMGVGMAIAFGGYVACDVAAWLKRGD